MPIVPPPDQGVNTPPVDSRSNEIAQEPYYVSALVERALSEAARTGRDINIAGALYRKVNHGEVSTPSATRSVHPLDVPCEHCKESIGVRCAGTTGAGFHPARWVLRDETQRLLDVVTPPGQATGEATA